MLGNGQLELLLGSIGALSTWSAIAWLTYCVSRYVLSDVKADYTKLRVAMKALSIKSVSIRGGASA